MLTKEDKIIFMDSETYFSPGIKSNETKYHTPILRLLTYKFWDGEKFSRIKQYDTQEDSCDPWEEIRDLMSKGYVLLAHNGIMFDFQPSLINHNTKQKDWILPYLIKGQIWDTMSVEKIISGMNPDKSDELVENIDAIEKSEEEEAELEETEVDGTKLRGFSLKVLVWKYCKIKLDKKFQEYKYYVSIKEKQTYSKEQKTNDSNYYDAANYISTKDYLSPEEINSSNVIDNIKSEEIYPQLTTSWSPDLFYAKFSNLVISFINLLPSNKLTEFREFVFADYDQNVFLNEHLINKANFEDIGHDYLFCKNYKEFLEKLITFAEMHNSISNLPLLKVEAIDLLEIFNQAMVDLNKYGKGGIVKEAIKYSLDDIEYLPDIYENQKRKIKALEDSRILVSQALELTHKLGATTYIGQKYGVAVNVADVKKYTEDYTQSLEKLAKCLQDEFPKVSKSNAELIDLYSDAVWIRGQEIGGIKTKADFKKALKLGSQSPTAHAICKGFDLWKEKAKDQVTKIPKLGSYANVKEALNKMGIKVEDTRYETLKDYSIKNDAPIIDTLLQYKEKNALLTKTLTKFTYNCYLRPDNTVPTTYHFTGPANWRSSSKNPNVQNLSRDLKSLFHTPPGMYNISYDLSGIELVKLVDQYKPKSALESFNFPDQHIYFAAMYYDLDPYELYDRYKNEDPEAELLRQSSKTLTYMNIYKSPCDPKSNFVTGVKKTQQIFKTELGIDLEDKKGERLILNCERVFDTWTHKKLEIEKQIRDRWKQFVNEKDRSKKEKLRKLGYVGPLNHLAKFYLDEVYSPDQDYVNARSIYSVLIAGFIAVGVKSSVMDINEFFFNNFTLDKARLTLTVHDSNTAYVVPEVFESAKKGYVERFLKNVYINSKFQTLPIEIEGYCSTYDFKQILPDGSLYTPELNDKGKLKYKKEKYRITPDLLISQV